MFLFVAQDLSSLFMPNAKLEQRRINNSTNREKEEPSKKSKYSKPPRLWASVSKLLLGKQ